MGYRYIFRVLKWGMGYQRGTVLDSSVLFAVLEGFFLYFYSLQCRGSSQGTSKADGISSGAAGERTGNI